jgi:hypothetical protein
LGLIVYFLTASFPLRKQGADFPEFYAAARIVLEGRGHQLYDIATQEQFQIRYSGRIGTYFIHPAFETLIYLPFSLFPIDKAYSLWCWFNSLLLVLTAVLFSRNILPPMDWATLLPFSFVYPPLLLVFFQGQDAVLLLLLLTGVFVSLQKDKEALAGFLLACALFKFNLVLPLVLLLIVAKRVKALRAFGVSTVALVLISMGLCGFDFLHSYPGLLTRISTLRWAAIHPADMENIRGFIAFCGLHGSTGFLTTLVVSAGIVLWPAWLTFRANRERRLDMAFAAFLLAAALVSYHISQDDFTILLLPLGLVAYHLLNTPQIGHLRRLSMIVASVILWLPPWHILLVKQRIYSFMVLPIILLYVCTCLEMQRLQSSRAVTT